MKKTKEKKLTTQEVMIQKYVDWEYSAVNKVYPVMDNGKKNWTEFDLYEKTYDKTQQLSKMIESEVLDGYLKNTDVKVKSLNTDVKSEIFGGLLMAGWTTAVGLIFKDIPFALVLGSLLSAKHLFNAVIKKIKAVKLAKNCKKISHEWEILHSVPDYVNDFCRFNDIKVNEGPFDDDYYLVWNKEKDIKVTTEERDLYDRIGAKTQSILSQIEERN